MNTANLELCEELFELSGWQPPSHYYDYWINVYGEGWKVLHVGPKGFPGDEPGNDYVPAYTLDYLLRRLPKHIDNQWLRIAPITDDKWAAYYVIMGVKTAGQDEWADTPENATCKLTTELFKQGILTPTKEQA